MHHRVRTTLRYLAVVTVLVLAGAALWIGPYAFRVHHVTADPQAGFHSGYFLYVPRRLAVDAQGTGMVLVQPNNSGVTSNDPGVHVRDAWWTGFERQRIADELGTPLLVPTFPRSATNWRVYTHALDRDTLTTRVPELARLDLQLLAMVDDARVRLAQAGTPVAPHILIQGFSASGMFANRFTVLHPERVRAAAIGSPGGWPVAPVPEADGMALGYPAGVADLQALTGRAFDAAAFARVPQLVYMGATDDNDSLDFKDGWDPPMSTLVDTRFGATPVARWTASEALYKGAGIRARFDLVPDVGHDRKALQDRSTAFMRDVLRQDGRRLE